MKKWKDTPEFRKLYKELCEECEKINKIEEASSLEFDPKVESLTKDMYKKYDNFIEQYIKERPEEFDENGEFKDDTK